MRSHSIIGAGVLCLLLGTAAPGSAQQSQDPKPPRREPKEERRQGQEHDAPTPSGLQSREPVADRRPVEQREQRETWRRFRAHTWRTEHRAWRDRDGYHGFRIPDDHFRDHFGRGHWFRIYGRPMVMVGRYPRFQYDGYWFRLVDPWPEDWADDWYQTDDVYIDYTDDGYYLYNRNHPGVRVAVTVYAE